MSDLLYTLSSVAMRNITIHRNQSWLSTFGAGARVKKREFAVIAHGIRVNQVQGQG